MKKLTEKEITDLVAAPGRIEAQFSEVEFNELDKMAQETISGFVKLYPDGGGKMKIENWIFEEVDGLIYATKKGEEKSLPLNFLPDPEKKEIHALLTNIDYTDPKYNPQIPGSEIKLENDPGADYIDPEKNPMIPGSETPPDPKDLTDPRVNDFIPDND